MQTEKLTSEIEAIEARGGHVQALLASLGNPAEWSYTGTCVDAGPASEATCACGHPIRFCFIIAHSQRGQTQVGSTCINHIAAITPELGATLTAAREALETKLAEAKRKAARAAKDEENARLWVEYSAKREEAERRHKANRAAGQRSPYDLWYFVEGWHEKYFRRKQPEYTRPTDLRRWLAKAIERATSALTAE